MVSLGSIRARDRDVRSIPRARDTHQPWIAADLAVLYERASDVLFDLDLERLAAVRTGDDEFVHALVA